MVTDIDFLVIQQHPIHSFDGGLGSLSSFIVDKSVSLGAALFISGNLARQHIAESGKCVMESLSKCEMQFEPIMT